MASIEELAKAMVEGEEVYSTGMDRWYSIISVNMHNTVAVGDGGCLNGDSLLTRAQYKAERVKNGELFTRAEVVNLIQTACAAVSEHTRKRITYDSFGGAKPMSAATIAKDIPTENGDFGKAVAYTLIDRMIAERATKGKTDG